MKKYILGTLVIIAGIFTASAASAQDLIKYEYERDLVHGSSGNAVVKLEFCLNHISGADFAIDGYYSTHTKNLVSVFQKKHGLRADGVLGAKTAAKVATLCNGTTEPKNNKLVKVETDISKKMDTAELDFSFKLKNTTSDSITIAGRNAFVFEMNGVKYTAEQIDTMKGISADVYNKKGKKINSDYVFKKGTKEEISLHLELDADKIPALKDSYVFRLVSLNWDLAGKSKVLMLGSSSEKFTLVK